MSLKIEFNPANLSDQERAAIVAVLDVMGGRPLTFAAPSTVGVGQSLTAPAAVPAGLPTPPTAAPAAAPTPDAPDDAAATDSAFPLMTPAGIAIDAEGVPHDPRIHATPATITKKNVWRAKRGLNDEAMVNRVKGELKAALLAGGAVVQQVPTPPAAVTMAPAGNVPPVAATTAILPAPPVNTGVPAAAPTSPASVPPVAGGAGGFTMDMLLPRCTAAVAAGTIPQDALQQVCQMMGYPGPIGLIQNQQRIPEAWAMLTAQYPALAAAG